MSTALHTNDIARRMSYRLKDSEPELQFLPTILFMWIVDKLFVELDLPNPPNPSADERHFEGQRGRRWSARMLKSYFSNFLSGIATILS